MIEKVAAVTGACRGLGFAVAKRLCQKLSPTDTVYLSDKDDKYGYFALKRLPDDIKSSANFQPLDVTDKNSVQGFAKYIQCEHGGFDYLVNTVETMDFGRLYPLYDGAKRAIEVNYKSLLNIEESLFPMLRDGARVLNITSACGHLSNLRNEKWVNTLRDCNLTTDKINMFVDEYLESVKNGTFKKEDFADDGKHAEQRVSKVAVTALTMVQSRKYSRRNISVNALSPGHLTTDRGHGDTSPDYAALLVTYLLLEAPPTLTGTLMWHDKRLIDWYDPSGDFYYVHKDLEKPLY